MEKHNHIYGTSSCMACRELAEPIEELDEFAPHSNSDLAKKMNEIIRKTNKNDSFSAKR